MSPPPVNPPPASPPPASPPPPLEPTTRAPSPPEPTRPSPGPVHVVARKPVQRDHPERGPIPWTPMDASEPAPPPESEPPRRPAPRPDGLADPLATPPIMLAEWDRFGDEEEDAFWTGRRRTMVVRGLAVLGGVAVVAGAVWIWGMTRAQPPFEPRSSALPRASVPPAAGTPDTTAAGEVGTEAEPTRVAAAGDSVPVPDTALAPATQVAAAAAAAARTPSVGPAAAGTGAPLQRYSWSMAAMGTLDAARAMVERLRRRAPEHAFIVAPIASDGRTVYRVLGGLAADREELAALREPLGQATREQAGSWLVREAPLAFALQDFDDAAGAAARVNELWQAGVPTYALVVGRDDGSVTHRVYAGAYASEAEASALRAMLERAGVRDARLVERRGRAGG